MGKEQNEKPLVTMPMGSGKTSAYLRNSFMGGSAIPGTAYPGPVYIVTDNGKNPVDVMDWVYHGAPQRKEVELKPVREAVWPKLTGRARRLHSDTLRWAMLLPLTQWDLDTVVTLDQAVTMLTEAINDYADQHAIGYRIGDPT